MEFIYVKHLKRAEFSLASVLMMARDQVTLCEWLVAQSSLWVSHFREKHGGLCQQDLFCECHEVRMKGFCKVHANGIVMTKPQMLFSLICIKTGPGTRAFHQFQMPV